MNTPPEFDELTYLELNPDLESAVLAGAIPSGYDHWTQYGQAERRLTARPKPPANAPAEWNEARYLRANPDVAAAVISGGFPSGYQHWVDHGIHEARSGGAITYTKTAPAHVLANIPAGFNAFGYDLADNGLGNATRGYADVFRTLSNRLRQVTVPLWGADPPPARGFDPERSPYAFNFIHQNPDVMPLFFSHFGRELLDGRINLGYWVWEMHAGYPEWHRLSRLFHEIWVPSTYVAQSLQPISVAPVHVIPHVVDGLPKAPVLRRADLNLPEKAFVFLSVLDVASTLGRKNPLAVLRAFRNVFRAREDVVLLLKYHNAGSDAAGVESLERLASPYANVHMLNRTLPAEQVYSLFQLSDCFVSPHRSEGFGLNIATAMYYGKPVIATGYSGNMDYMDETTAFPIDYEVVPAGGGHRHYRPGYGWAEPSPEHLEALLHQVYEQREHASGLGATGRKRIQQQHSVYAVAQQIRARIEAITGVKNLALSGDLL